jgi:hypothetical protein
MEHRKPLSQDEIWKLLEGQEDILTPLVKKEQAFFRNCPCPSCGEYSHSQLVNARRPFSEGSPLPNIVLKCLHCRTEFDPNTRLVTSYQPAIPERD